MRLVCRQKTLSLIKLFILYLLKDVANVQIIIFGRLQFHYVTMLAHPVRNVSPPRRVVELNPVSAERNAHSV